MASLGTIALSNTAHASHELPAELQDALRECARLLTQAALRTSGGLPSVIESVEKAIGAKLEVNKPTFRFPTNIYGKGVLVEEVPGTFRVKITTANDALGFLEHGKREILDSVNEIVEEPIHTRYLSHSAKETDFVRVKFGLKVGDTHIVYKSAGKPSTHAPATTFHFQAAIASQLLLSPEALVRSFSQIHSLEDAQTQREWITLVLLEEAANWPIRQADTRQAEILTSHIKMLAAFDRRARKNGSNYASPFKIPENIALAKIWLDHQFSAISHAINEQLRVDGMSDGKIIDSTLLEDTLTVHQNLYEIWKKSPNVGAKKKIAEIIDDAKFLAEIVFLVKHPTEQTEKAPQLKNLYRVEQEIYDIKPALEREPESTELSVEEVAEIERLEDEEASAAAVALQQSLDLAIQRPSIGEAIEPSVEPAHDAEKTLTLERNGNLILPDRDSASTDWVLRVEAQEPENATQDWSIRLNRVSKKEWLALSKYADAKGATFFRRMNQALGTILKLGYYQALSTVGFPYKKQIHRTQGAFELILGSERRIIYTVNDETRTITVTSISAHHKVDY